MKSSDARQALHGAMQDQACQWIVRLRSDSVSDADLQEFSLWLASNPAHRGAMDAMQDLWGDLAVLELYETGTAAADATVQPRSPLRRHWLAGAASLAAGLFLAVLLLPNFDANTEAWDYQTRVGETLDVDLEDGSTVKLNTDTSLAVAYDTSQRALHLRRGEAFFQVAHDAERPFVVRAGDFEVRALGTAFNIQLNNGVSVVTVSEGVVRVTELNPPSSRPAQTELLYSDQGLTGDGSGLGTPAAIDVGAQLAWRDGKLIAEQMPLTVLVQELSRYHPGAYSSPSPPWPARLSPVCSRSRISTASSSPSSTPPKCAVLPSMTAASS